MDAKKNTTTGTLKISEDVIAEIAKRSAKEVKGFHSFSAGKANIKALAMKANAKDSVKITLNGEVAQIDLSIIISNGTKIKDVCEAIQRTVKDDVQNMTSVTVSKVNVYIAGVVTE